MQSARTLFLILWHEEEHSVAPALQDSFYNKGDRRIVHTPDYNSNKNQIGISATIKVFQVKCSETTGKQNRN